MTAEIAVLNKLAVALAADSAVTISAGDKQEKTFDSADKLFELSDHNPIGIMIFNNMSFMEAPMPVLIRQFRQRCKPVSKVDEIAMNFLNYLYRFGNEAPQDVKNRAVRRIVSPLMKRIAERFSNKFTEEIFKADLAQKDVKTISAELSEEVISLFEFLFQRRKDALFVGGDELEFSPQIHDLIADIVKEECAFASEDQRSRLINIGKLALQKAPLSDGLAGIVIAGFGSNDMFPSLASFEIDGFVCGRLKYAQTNSIKIDRLGAKASVLPFAQKEMVERFLYGLDENIERAIISFCEKAIPDIRSELFKNIEFGDPQNEQAWQSTAEAAEQAFTDKLREQAFDKIRQHSRAEIEDMVEFMPKPELAKMAEALVNLTSIKRRVSRGMETVGGPIDVAVISHSEGFVWIKRKHYFPSELNARYFHRVSQALNGHRETEDGEAAKPRRSASRRRAKETIKIPQGVINGDGLAGGGNAERN